MTDDTIPVPREVVEDLLEHTLNIQARSELQSAYDAATPTPAPRLRVVNLDALSYEQARDDMWVRADELEALPDPLTVIDRDRFAAILRQWWDEQQGAEIVDDFAGAIAVLDYIRAALIEAAS